MSRRSFLKGSALLGAAAFAGCSTDRSAPAQTADSWPNFFVMGGHAKPGTSFSAGLDLIGSRLTERFGERIDPRYAYDVEGVGFEGTDMLWLVSSNMLALAYSTDAGEAVPALDVAALPFLFSSTDEARAAMDGPLGQAAIDNIESRFPFRVLGFFENGFRHLSNSVRPVRTLADMNGLSIRVFPAVQEAFRLLGAEVVYASISETIPRLADGRYAGQENPFENVVGYGMQEHQRYYTVTNHSYLSRPIFVHRPTFDAWPQELQSEIREAVADAVTLQRELHDVAEVESADAIREAGGEIIELTAEQRGEFVAAVESVYVDARSRYDAALLAAVGL
ncbi:MAG: TRAP transporter substrate-binding protein [Candidatus Rariloculaceae bacterium]